MIKIYVCTFLLLFLSYAIDTLLRSVKRVATLWPEYQLGRFQWNKFNFISLPLVRMFILLICYLMYVYLISYRYYLYRTVGIYTSGFKPLCNILYTSYSPRPPISQEWQIKEKLLMKQRCTYFEEKRGKGSHDRGCWQDCDTGIWRILIILF